MGRLKFYDGSSYVVTCSDRLVTLRIAKQPYQTRDALPELWLIVAVCLYHGVLSLISDRPHSPWS